MCHQYGKAICVSIMGRQFMSPVWEEGSMCHQYGKAVCVISMARLYVSSVLEGSRSMCHQKRKVPQYVSSVCEGSRSMCHQYVKVVVVCVISMYR